METIRRTAEFDATPEAVFAVISDPKFQQAKAEGTVGIPGASATVTPAGDGVRIETVRLLPTASMPDFVKSFVGEQLRVTEVQTWGPARADGGRAATVEAVVQGAPVTLRGDLVLDPSGTGSSETFEGQLSAEVFLLGGKVEKAASPFLAQAVEAEFELIRQHLQP
ncbi:MAG: DUF2505 domain-containing protein [Nostocoides sp.]